MGLVSTTNQRPGYVLGLVGPGAILPALQSAATTTPAYLAAAGEVATASVFGIGAGFAFAPAAAALAAVPIGLRRGADVAGFRRPAQLAPGTVGIVGTRRTQVDNQRTRDTFPPPQTAGVQLPQPPQPGPINNPTGPFVERPPSTPSTPPTPPTQQPPTAGGRSSATADIPSTLPPGPTSFIGQIPFFLNAILSTPAGALPKGPLWVVVFDFDTYIKSTIKRVKEYEPRMPEPWEIDNALETVTTHRYQTEKGCMFAQTVTLPGEALLYTREGIQYNSFIRGGVGQGRQDFDSVRIGFLNTNINFVDNVIRPWVVMTGHLGMIARPPEKKYRCNMTVYKLGIDKVDRPPFVAQQFNFWEVCPINVSNENLDYTGDGRTPIKEAEFVYQWYTTTSYKNTFATSNAEEIFAGTGRPDIRRATFAGTGTAQVRPATLIPAPPSPTPPSFR